jgi:hypothetical protein
VKDQHVGEHVPVTLREQPHQVHLDFDRFRVAGEPEALTDALHVGVDHHAFRCPERDAQHHVRGLSADAGKLHQRFQRARHFSAMFGDELLRKSHDRFGLLTEEAGLQNHRFDFFGLRACERGRRRPAPEQLGRHRVDHHVGALRGKHGGDQELKG